MRLEIDPGYLGVRPIDLELEREPVLRESRRELARAEEDANDLVHPESKPRRASITSKGDKILQGCLLSYNSITIHSTAREEGDSDDPCEDEPN